MNRIPKFRGMTTDGVWRYGYFVVIENKFHIFEEGDLCEDGHHVRQESDRPTWIVPETLGEYSGINDKNGLEIYEGDVVVFDKGLTMRDDGKWVSEKEEIIVKCKDGSFNIAPMSLVSDRFEVVGCIHGAPFARPQG